MEHTQEKLKKVLESKLFIGIVYGAGIMLVVIIIFAAGVGVGFHKATFGRNWNEHYNENFGMGRMMGMNKNGMMDTLPNSHGSIGKIIKLELPTILVEDKGNIEKSIAITSGTQIQKGQDTITSADLEVDDFVVVIGSPDDKGVIDAKLIRVIPSPESLIQ